jgi:hypothetical protein
LGSRLLLIDMGGGTTDFALLQMPKSPEQRPICRPVDPAPVVPGWGSELTSYGGRDLDQLLLQYLGRDWDAEWMARHCSLLMQEVRRFKEEFSNNVREGIHRHESIWLVGEQHCRISLTREEFEKVAGDYMAHFEALVLGALALAGVTPRQVAAVILAGGHSRWYFVDQTLNGIFPHLSRGAGHLLRHSRPEQSVARGLGYAPMVRGAGAKILAPVRKSAHSFWVYVPYGSPVLQGSGEGTMGRRSQERRPVWDEPVRILPRGHQLPFRTPKPLRIAVNQLGLDAREASVRIQFYSSAGGSSRIPLYERVARFERNPWESLLKRFGTRLPWGKGLDEDQFELLIMCEVDENELLMAELVIIRYFRGKQVALQRQKLQVNNATSSTLPAAAADPPVRQTAPSPA